MLKTNGQNSNSSQYRVVEADFTVSASTLRQCPAPTLPEIAIAGRSNVGKSSLINRLCNRRNLAKTSSTPGKTRLINFFRLRIEPENMNLHLIDLPGYGYARAGKEVQAEWGRALDDFLEHRKLQGILHLIDSRHEPTSLDIQMREWIVHREIPSITVLTKSDKLNQKDIARLRQSIQSSLQLSDRDEWIITSVTKSTGIEELCQILVRLLQKPDSIGKHT